MGSENAWLVVRNSSLEERAENIANSCLGTMFAFMKQALHSRLAKLILNRINLSRSELIYAIIHYALRTIILVACILGCFAQIGAIINLFFSYPTYVFVDLKQMEKLLLPAITLCNENRFGQWNR